MSQKVMSQKDLCYSVQIKSREEFPDINKVKYLFSGDNVINATDPVGQFVTYEISTFDWGNVDFCVKKNVGVIPLSLLVEAPEAGEHLTIRICISGGVNIQTQNTHMETYCEDGKFTLLALPEIEPVQFYIDPDKKFICMGFYINKKMRLSLFDGVELSEDLLQLKEDVISRPYLGTFPVTTTLTRIAHEAFMSPYSGKPEIFYQQAKALEALTEIIDIFGTKNVASSSSNTKVLMARDMLIQDLSAPRPLHLIAHDLGINPRKLSSEFKKYFGVTAAEYLKGKKMELARQLLKNKKYSVAEVAYKIGYEHSANFITAYRNHFDSTPGSEKK